MCEGVEGEWQMNSLIQFALRHYGLPPYFQRLVFDYYERLFAIVDVPSEFQSKPFHFAIGVFQGCTLSPLLFNIVIHRACLKVSGYKVLGRARGDLGAKFAADVQV